MEAGQDAQTTRVPALLRAAAISQPLQAAVLFQLANPRRVYRDPSPCLVPSLESAVPAFLERLPASADPGPAIAVVLAARLRWHPIARANPPQSVRCRQVPAGRVRERGSEKRAPAIARDR